METTRRHGLWRALRGWLLLALILGGAYAALHLWLLKPKPIPVEVRVIDRGPVERIVTNTRAGTVRARLSARVAPESAGRIVSIAFREGASVHRGALVVQLDDRLARAQLALIEREIESARARVSQARARLLAAERERARLERLFAEGNVSEQQIDQARSRVDIEQAALEAAEALVAQEQARRITAELERDKLSVTAPFDGVVTELYRELGEWAGPGTALFELISLEDLYASLEIDEVDSAELRVGLPARLHLDAYPDRVFEAHITRVGERVSELREQARTIEIELAFDRLTEHVRLLPGMSVDVEVVLERTPQPVVRVPTLALLEGERVLVAQDGLAHERKIETGIGNWEFTEVRSGLAPGERVIVSLDKEELRDGVPIVIEGDAVGERDGAANARSENAAASAKIPTATNRRTAEPAHGG